MKFTYKTSQAKARYGCLFDFSKISDLKLETPLLLLHTKSGSVPHITKEVLQMITKEFHAVQFAMPSTVLVYEAVKEFSKGIAQFCGLKEHISYCSVQDPSVLTPVGYNSKNAISVWSHTGRVSLDAEKYMDIMEAFQPSFYQVLCNSDTNIETGKKKTSKVFQSSKSLFEACLKRHQDSTILKSSGLIGVVEGGYNLELRKMCAEYLSNQPVDGFAIEGLHNNGPDVENIGIDKVYDVIETTLKYLPEEKFKIVHGCWKPVEVLKMIDMGVDVFDSSLPFVVTERKCAMVFKYFTNYSECNDRLNNSGEFEISLNDTRFKDDFGPILKGCNCLSCKKHSKAYIHHLLDNKELLGSTLLMIHNLHHYLEFFKSIRYSLKENKKLFIQ